MTGDLSELRIRLFSFGRLRFYEGHSESFNTRDNLGIPNGLQICRTKLECFYKRQQKSKRKNINLIISGVILNLPSV